MTETESPIADSRLPIADLTHIDAWVFDLDNTLYPADCNLFKEIDARMEQYICDRLGLSHEHAKALRKDYYVRYGTTMSGLMRERGVDPEDFLAYVHDIDLSPVSANESLTAAIAALPGKRYIFTNGSVRHAENVMGKLGVLELFDDIFDIRAAAWTPKPHRETYDKFLAAHDVKPRSAAMFEDIAHNLEAAHALGMTTVLVASAAEWIADAPSTKRPARLGDRYDYVHHVTDDLTAFLVGARVRATLSPEKA
jgi:putative hydrolase of the HAD superfamily